MTMALQHYAQQSNGTVYVEANATTGSQRNILIAILEALEQSPGTQSTAQIMRRILATVRGTNRLLIIDEAQHLNERAFDTLRAINDKAGVSIVFAGNRGILKRMFGRMELEYDQLYSRIGGFCELHNRHSIEDIEGIHSGVSSDEDCKDYLQKVANQKGGLRRMVKEYKLAANIANTLGQDLTLPILQEADRRLNIVGRFS